MLFVCLFLCFYFRSMATLRHAARILCDMEKSTVMKRGKENKEILYLCTDRFSTDLSVPESEVQPYSIYRMKPKYCWHFGNHCFTRLSQCKGDYERYSVKCLLKRNTLLRAWCHRQNFGLFDHEPFYMTPGLLSTNRVHLSLKGEKKNPCSGFSRAHW